MGMPDIPGLRNLGNTCFLNAILQALASAKLVLDHLNGSPVPTESLTHTLAQCLEQLLPTSVRQIRGPASPLDVLKALRVCTDDTSCILDGKENDACEALQLLVSVIKEELQEHFRKHQFVPLSSQPALQDVLSFSWSCDVPEGAGSMPAKQTGKRFLTAEGWPKPGPKEQSSSLSQQSGNAFEELNVAGHADAPIAGMSVADCLILQLPSTHASDAEGSKAQDTTKGDGNALASTRASPVHVRVHAAEQAEPVFAAWRACRSPLELGQAQEIACLVCRRHTPTAMSSAVALPLVLPAVKGVLGSQAKPGTSLDAVLQSHFAAQPIHDAICTWCSLKWTLLEHRQIDKERPHTPLPHPGSTSTGQQRSESHASSAPQDHKEPRLCGSSASDAAAHQGPELPCAECEHSRAPEPVVQQQTANACNADAQLLYGCAQGPAPPVEAGVDSLAQLPGQRCACGTTPVQQPQPASGASNADVRLLEGCLRGACPLPEADVEGMARRAGMRWVQRRGTLLTRTLIARAPQVLCLQLQRVSWSFGSPEKLHGHVAFPLSLDLSPYCAAAAMPLLRRTRSQPAGQQEVLPHAPQASMYQGSAVSPEQRILRKASTHSGRDATQDDYGKAQLTIEPSGCEYRLVAVIVHHGSPRSGHYTTYRSLLGPAVRQPNERWWCVSDERVRDADDREVLACQASILLYEKTSN